MAFRNYLQQSAGQPGASRPFGCRGRIYFNYQVRTIAGACHRVGQVAPGLPGMVLADDHHTLRLRLVGFQLADQLLTNPGAIHSGPKFGVVGPGVARLAGGYKQVLEFMRGNRVDATQKHHMDQTLVGLRYILGYRLGRRALVGKRGHSHTTGQTKGHSSESTQEPQAVDAAPHGSSC
jgi:hypothetical protein